MQAIQNRRYARKQMSYAIKKEEGHHGQGDLKMHHVKKAINLIDQSANLFHNRACDSSDSKNLCLLHPGIS